MSHEDLIRDQFTRQALPFSTAAAITNEEALQLIVATTAAGPADTVLDVACGPGLVACAFAPRVERVEGIDLTPAMIDRARQLQAERGILNGAFRVGGVNPLPYAARSFTVVTCRYAFHHFPVPLAVLREMRRVCAPHGRVAVIDVALPADTRKTALYNRMEKLRDPSHVRALTLDELIGLFAEAELEPPVVTRYFLQVELEGLLASSFPDPKDLPEIRSIFETSLLDDGLGMETRREGGKILGNYPIAILVSQVAG